MPEKRMMILTADRLSMAIRRGDAQQLEEWAGKAESALPRA
jgi:hypothetical protein